MEVNFEFEIGQNVFFDYSGKVKEGRIERGMVEKAPSGNLFVRYEVVCHPRPMLIREVDLFHTKDGCSKAIESQQS